MMKTNLISKKAIIFESVMLLIIGSVLACVYLIDGMAGVYAWSFAVFILAPLAVLGSFIGVVILVVRICKRKRFGWNLICLATLFSMGFPILILFGLVAIPYPVSSHDGPVLTFRNPVVGDTIVFGGKSYHTHSVWPSECYAYDILAKPYNVNSNNLEDYGIFGRDIVIPIGGTVIEAHDGEMDIKPNTENFTSSLGNYIYVKVDKTDTYLIFAHLKNQSICVKAGDTVYQGAKIGQVGNSGTTSEPHLHFQHQRTDPTKMIFPICAEGLPMVLEKGDYQ